MKFCRQSILLVLALIPSTSLKAEPVGLKCWADYTQCVQDGINANIDISRACYDSREACLLRVRPEPVVIIAEDPAPPLQAIPMLYPPLPYPAPIPSRQDIRDLKQARRQGLREMRQDQRQTRKELRQQQRQERREARR